MYICCVRKIPAERRNLFRACGRRTAWVQKILLAGKDGRTAKNRSPFCRAPQTGPSAADTTSPLWQSSCSLPMTSKNIMPNLPTNFSRTIKYAIAFHGRILLFVRAEKPYRNFPSVERACIFTLRYTAGFPGFEIPGKGRVGRQEIRSRAASRKSQVPKRREVWKRADRNSYAGIGDPAFEKRSRNRKAV